MKQSAKSTPQVRAGLDVGATELVLSLQRDGQLTPPHALPNTPAGHRALIRLLTARGAQARVCLEATGVYSLGVALALHRATRIEVMVVNPRAIKDFQRARLTRAKTDRVDALGILEFLQRMDFVPWTPPSDAVLALQQLGRRLVQLRGELTREHSSGARKTAAGSPKGARGGAHQPRLHAIAYTPDHDGLIAADLQAHIRHLQKRIKALQQAAAELAARAPELAAKVQRLCSVPGIGQLSALRLLGELLVLPKDLKAKQWVAHAGLDPRPRQSGASDAPRQISRTGNRHLRHALFMPVLVAIQRCPQYDALLTRGKKKKVALIALMRRLLHALWGMLHHQQDFNPHLFHPLLPSPYVA